jgi:hypothetical protein
MESGSVPNEFLNQLSQVPEAKDHALHPAGCQETQLVGDKRLSIDWQQRFGDSLRERAQARRQSTREDCNWQHVTQTPRDPAKINIRVYNDTPLKFTRVDRCCLLRG